MQEDSFFETISNHYSKELPFVVYCKPFSFDIIGWLQKDDALFKINDFSESGFVFSPFDFRKDSILIPYSKSKQIKLSDELNTHGLEDTSSLDDCSNSAPYMKLVAKALDSINDNSFQKVVVSREEVIELPSFDLIRTLKKLLISYNSAFVYCWYHPKVGLWLGASPETLMKIEGNRFETMALAGSLPYMGCLDQNWPLKEQIEHDYVIRYISDVIKSNLTDIEISESQTVKAGELLHLKTDISARISFGIDTLKKLILKLHPTPAVCGVPKMEALQFIIDNEGYNREFYTGFLGEINKEAKIEMGEKIADVDENIEDKFETNTELFVNLRCMQLRKNSVHVYAGGGITKDSNPESEWKETVNKTKTIKAVIAF